MVSSIVPCGAKNATSVAKGMQYKPRIVPDNNDNAPTNRRPGPTELYEWGARCLPCH